MIRLPAVVTFVAGALGAGGAPGPSAAQVVPGGSGAPEARRARAEYKARVMEQVQKRMQDWREAWAADDAETLIRFYHEDVVFRPPRSGALRGRDLVGRFLTQALPLAGDLQTGLTDLEGSGRYAYVTGPWQHENDGTVWTGDYVMLLETGRSLAVRVQLFSTSAEAAAPGLPALGGGGSEFDAVDLGVEHPELRTVLDRISGAWLAGDRLRMGALWTEDVLFQAWNGERAFGREAALDLWASQRRENESVQDLAIDVVRSERIAFAFVQRVTSWREHGLTRTRTLPAVVVFYREGDDWLIRSWLLLDWG